MQAIQGGTKNLLVPLRACLDCNEVRGDGEEIG